MSEERKGVEVMFTSGLRVYPEATQWLVDDHGRLNVYHGDDLVALYQDREWRAVYWEGEGRK